MDTGITTWKTENQQKFCSEIFSNITEKDLPLSHPQKVLQ